MIELLIRLLFMILGAVLGVALDKWWNRCQIRRQFVPELRKLVDSLEHMIQEYGKIETQAQAVHWEPAIPLERAIDRFILVSHSEAAYFLPNKVKSYLHTELLDSLERMRNVWQHRGHESHLPIEVQKAMIASRVENAISALQKFKELLA